MVRAVCRKRRRQRGFTLAELLAATILTLLSTSLIAGTLKIGIQRYQSGVGRTEARLLCLNLSRAVEWELSRVRAVSGQDGFCVFDSGDGVSGEDVFWAFGVLSEEDSGAEVLVRVPLPPGNGADYGALPRAERYGGMKAALTDFACHAENGTVRYFSGTLQVRNGPESVEMAFRVVPTTRNVPVRS